MTTANPATASAHVCVRGLATTNCTECGRDLPLSHPTCLTHPDRTAPRNAAIAATFPSPHLGLAHELLTILDAVDGGGTVVLTGPDLLSRVRNYGVRIESSTGARFADAYGPELGAVLVEAVKIWRSK